MGIDSQLSVSFLMSRPAAELLSVSPLSIHRAYLSPSLSARDPTPREKISLPDAYMDVMRYLEMMEYLFLWLLILTANS